jgi:hypothetical protein
MLRSIPGSNRINDFYDVNEITPADDPNKLKVLISARSELDSESGMNRRALAAKFVVSSQYG